MGCQNFCRMQKGGGESPRGGEWHWPHIIGPCTSLSGVLRISGCDAAFLPSWGHCHEMTMTALHKRLVSVNSGKRTLVPALPFETGFLIGERQGCLKLALQSVVQT